VVERGFDTGIETYGRTSGIGFDLDSDTKELDTTNLDYPPCPDLLVLVSLLLSVVV
jgi:hypothetical protein